MTHGAQLRREFLSRIDNSIEYSFSEGDQIPAILFNIFMCLKASGVYFETFARIVEQWANQWLEQGLQVACTVDLCMREMRK